MDVGIIFLLALLGGSGIYFLSCPSSEGWELDEFIFLVWFTGYIHPIHVLAEFVGLLEELGTFSAFVYHRRSRKSLT